MDDTREIKNDQPASLNTTARLTAEADEHDFVMHVGDIAYAEGFSTSVSVVKTVEGVHDMVRGGEGNYVTSLYNAFLHCI